MDTIKNLISRKRIPTFNSEEPIGSVFETVTGSHDAVFVEDDKKNIIGVTSLTYVLFKRRYPPTTKIGNTVIVPPHITRNTSVFDVAKYMVSTRFYKLPVYTDGHIEGIITAKALMRYLLKNNELLSKVVRTIASDPPFTTTPHATTGEIYNKLRKEESSHIVIIDEKGKLEGIVTRSDVKDAFLVPLGFGKRGKNKGVGRSINFDQEDITRFEFSVGNYMRRDVVRVPVGTRPEVALGRMVEADVNSIVFVTPINKPKRILTTYSYLRLLSREKPQSTFELKLTDKDGVIGGDLGKSIRNMVQRHGNKIDKADPIRHIELTIKSYRNINDKKTGYEINLHVHSYEGKGYVAKVENKRLLTGIREAFRKVHDQQD